MQLSRFVVRYEDIRPGEHILYSVLHDRYIGIDDATREALGNWCRGSAPSGDSEEEVASALLEEGFLIREREEDDRSLDRHLDQARGGIPRTMMVTLMPTLACNLACDYCFQKESPAFNKMSRPTEHATVDWILGAIRERGLTTLKIHYFGGEPLTRKDYCLRTAELFHAAMSARGGTFEWSMTTNGVHLDLAFVQAMKKFGRSTIKVTFDGDKETHDRSRVYRDGRGTFDVIFANVMACAPHIPIRIGGNFLPHQAASYERLLERLESAGLSGVIASVKFKPVHDVTRESGASCSGCDHGSAGEATALVQLNLNKSINKRKLGAHAGETLEGMLGPCELHWRNNYTIDPDGKIYKCPAVAGRPELAVADVNAIAEEKPAPLLAKRPWEQCGDCSFMPVCMGGCLGSRWLKTRTLRRSALPEASVRAQLPRDDHPALSRRVRDSNRFWMKPLSSQLSHSRHRLSSSISAIRSTSNSRSLPLAAAQLKSCRPIQPASPSQWSRVKPNEEIMKTLKSRRASARRPARPCPARSWWSERGQHA